MKIEGKEYRTIWFENDIVKIIDQTKLPHQFIIKNLKTVKDVINASTIARDVNNPNKTVGKKLDKERIQKPAAIVVAV